MKFLLSAGLAAVLVSPLAALAEPVTRTATIDTPRYEGDRTVTRDREAGTIERDSTLTRRADGAVATHSYDRQRTETGAVASGSTTRFDGATRSFDAERTRTAHGYRTQGNFTGFDGASYDYRAAGRRTPGGGFVRRQGLRDGEGDLVAGRRVAVRHGPNGVARRSTRFGRRF